MSFRIDVRLLFLRHGQTDLNLCHKMQGQVDEPLNDTGRAQLTAAGRRLQGEEISAVYASDLIRARESAEIASRIHGLPIRTDSRLREQDLGDWDGKDWFQLNDLFGPDSRDRFLGDLDFAPGGGESRRQLRDRLRRFLSDLLDAHRDGETVLVVSHGGLLFAMLHEALDLSYTPRKRAYAANGSLSEFVHMNGGWQLVSFNETWFQGQAGNATMD